MVNRLNNGNHLSQFSCIVTKVPNQNPRSSISTPLQPHELHVQASDLSLREVHCIQCPELLRASSAVGEHENLALNVQILNLPCNGQFGDGQFYSEFDLCKMSTLIVAHQNVDAGRHARDSALSSGQNPARRYSGIFW